MILKTLEGKKLFTVTSQLISGTEKNGSYTTELFRYPTIHFNNKKYSFYETGLFRSKYILDCDDTKVVSELKKKYKYSEVECDSKIYRLTDKYLFLSEQNMGSIYYEDDGILSSNCIFTVNFKDQVPLEMHFYCLCFLIHNFQNRSYAP